MVVYAKKRKTIRDFPKSKRPRERLFSLGVANLTTVELLAIILGSGTKKRNVLRLAKEIVKAIPIRNLPHAHISDLTKIKGIGPVQAGKILASLELGRRALEEMPAKRILTPNDVVREVDDITKKTREYLIALYLNARHELIKKQTITIGNLNQNIVDPRDVFAQALSLPCAYVILVHNHPSGDPKPSQDDKRLTKVLVKAGRILGVNLIDHIIVSKRDYFSFREAKLL